MRVFCHTFRPARDPASVDPDDIDFGDFEEWSLDPPDPDDAPPPPDYRATVVGARVTLIPWGPHLVVGPAHRALLREREAAGVTVADLTVSGSPPGREVVMRFLARGAGAGGERALLRWAAATGHRRVWLPGKVIPLSPPKRFGQARTTCSNCGVEWRESDPEFWAGVQSAGTFPGFCLICGGDLPQWARA
jgi:hypothetical protein